MYISQMIIMLEKKKLKMVFYIKWRTNYDQAFINFTTHPTKGCPGKSYPMGHPLYYVKIVWRNGIIKKVELNEQCQNKCL